MGIMALCSTMGYYAFSYTTVDKRVFQRITGYVCTYLLTIALTISLLIIYLISVIWIPEMSYVWAIILLSLYAGNVIYDFLDLFRMGKDVVATSFYEKSIESIAGGSNDEVVSVINYLKEGHRLSFANSLIGKSIMELSKKSKDMDLEIGGRWILDNSEESQQNIDNKVADLFAKFQESDNKIAEIIVDLRKGQNQNIADSLIANLLEIVNNRAQEK